MEITLNDEQAALLVAVDEGRVTNDPRFTLPDFETDPGPPACQKRATRRLAPLKQWRLVELDEDSEPDRYGVRRYRLTGLGERVLAEIHEQEAASRTSRVA